MAAQMVAVQTPVVSSQNAYREQIGVHWGIDLPGSKRVVGRLPNGELTADGSIPIRFGTPPATPGGLSAGWGWRNRGGGGGFLTLAMGQQRSQRTLVGQSGSLTLTPGVPGYFFDGQLRPFVTGVVPVVGNAVVAPPPVLISPLQQRLGRLQAGEQPLPPPRSSSHVQAPPPLQAAPAPVRVSSAQRGDESLRVIRARQATTPLVAKHKQLMQRAQQAEGAGKLYAARQLLRQACKAAPANQRASIQAEITRVTGVIEAGKGI